MTTNPKIFVTAASGQLGGNVIETLLETLPASRIVAGVRNPAGDAANALRAKGVEIRVADYAAPDTLAAALKGVDRLLLISGNDLGNRGAQHRNVIDAAKAAGIGLIAYTSILHADTSPLFLADEHRETEADIVASGVPYVFLRNGWYTEVFTWRVPAALQTGTLNGAAGAGRIASAARADYARAAASVLAGDGHAGRIYELAGDTAFTLEEFADLVSEVSKTPVAYRTMDPEALHAALTAAGVPELLARIISDTDTGIAKDALFDDGHALSRLTGQPTTAPRASVAELIASLPR